MADRINPGVTAKQAKGLFCPATMSGPRLETCRGPQCMAWRWLQPSPPMRDPAHVYFDADDEEMESARVAEPARPEGVPPEWTWIPVTGEDEDITGGRWDEPPAIERDKNNSALAARLGSCGLVQGVSHV